LLRWRLDDDDRVGDGDYDESYYLVKHWSVAWDSDRAALTEVARVMLPYARRTRDGCIPIIRLLGKRFLSRLVDSTVEAEDANPIVQLAALPTEGLSDYESDASGEDGEAEEEEGGEEGPGGGAGEV
jgi:hypothetical protein